MLHIINCFYFLVFIFFIGMLGYPDIRTVSLFCTNYNDVSQQLGPTLTTRVQKTTFLCLPHHAAS